MLLFGLRVEVIVRVTNKDGLRCRRLSELILGHLRDPLLRMHAVLLSHNTVSSRTVVVILLHGSFEAASPALIALVNFLRGATTDVRASHGARHCATHRRLCHPRKSVVQM